MRLNKNINLLGLEGQPAFPIESQEWLGPKTSLAELKGKPVVLFSWAHWCGDCKTQGPILEALVNKYKSSGITVVAPTQRFGYVEKRKPADRAEELAYIERVRDQFYPWMKTVSGAGQRRLVLEVRRLDHADLRDDRSRRQGVVIPAGTADVRAARSVDQEDRGPAAGVQPDVTSSLSRVVLAEA